MAGSDTSVSSARAGSCEERGPAIGTAWSTTIHQARGLSESTLHERVNDEWSFVSGDGVETCQPRPYRHDAGCPAGLWLVSRL